MTIIKKAKREYRFMDKDPVKDKLQTVLQDVGMFSRQKLRQVAILANRAPATLDNLFFGNTRRPQNATIEAILEGVGYERVMQQIRVIKDMPAEINEARAANKVHKARKAKAAGRVPRKRRAKKGRPNLRLVV